MGRQFVRWVRVVLGVVGAALLVTMVGVPGGLATTGATSPTWTSHTIPGYGPLNAVACPSPLECFATGNGFVLRSTDGGTAWTASVPSSPANLLSVSCPSVSTCFAVGGYDSSVGVILATTDGGSTWVSQTVPPASGGLNAVSCSSTTHCVAVINFNAVGSPVLATFDGGATWSHEPTPAGAYDLDAVSCVAGTDDCMAADFIVITSVDGGVTWSKASTPAGATQTAVTCMSTANCVIFTGSTTSSPGASTTADFGASWVPSAMPALGNQMLSGVTCPISTNCVAVGSRGFNGQTDAVTSSDGGTTWTNQSVPSGIGFLSEASCPSATDCIAVGQDSGGRALVATGGAGTIAIPLTVTTTSLPTGSVYARTNKVRYSAQLTASGGNPPYRWTLAAGSSPLPPGLRLDAKGVITGKATTPGTYPITVQVADTKVKVAKHPPTQNTATAILSITVDPIP